jgi:hypothetical protein
MVVIYNVAVETVADYISLEVICFKWESFLSLKKINIISSPTLPDITI